MNSKALASSGFRHYVSEYLKFLRKCLLKVWGHGQVLIYSFGFHVIVLYGNISKFNILGLWNTHKGLKDMRDTIGPFTAKNGKF
jgi:hypothetical protein